MGTKTHTLCERLKETVDLLVGNREEHWAEWLRTALGRIENGDLSGIDHLLSAYGGMGSFNDLVIQPPHGQSLNSPDCASVNERLALLRSEMYELAHEVRREAVIE